VLVNQSPHQLDILTWLMGPVAEVSGYWANLNHPTVEVDDTAVAALRFRNGGLGSIVTSLSQKPGIYTKVHIHGATGASVGVETDRGATFIAGVSQIAEPPLTDLWTIPGEESQLAAFQAEDREAFARVDATTHYHALQIADFLAAVREHRPPLVTGEAGRAVVELFTAIYRSSREHRAVALPPAGGAP
jgi:predicted dehydrogenase